MNGSCDQTFSILSECRCIGDKEACFSRDGLALQRVPERGRPRHLHHVRGDHGIAWDAARGLNSDYLHNLNNAVTTGLFPGRRCNPGRGPRVRSRHTTRRGMPEISSIFVREGFSESHFTHACTLN